MTHVKLAEYCVVFEGSYEIFSYWCLYLRVRSMDLLSIVKSRLTQIASGLFGFG